MTMQHYFGSSDDFFHGKFITDKSPDDLAEFYQAEDLLKIIAVHPFFFNLFMNKVDPDTEMPKEDTALLSLDETHFRVRLLGMEVSFEIIEKEEVIDGETMVTSFMRHERFIDYVPFLADLGFKQLLWDQTWVYGFKRLDDGTFEVYHHGKKFYGPWLIRLIVFFHQYYVLWGCEKYINHGAFGTEDIDEQQEELACLPLHVFREFVTKLRAEKERSLEVLKSDPHLDHSAILSTTEAVDKLKRLSELDESTIAVAKRAGATGSQARPVAMKMVAGDAATQEALTAALKDEKGERDRAVQAMVKQVMRHPELEYKERPKRKSSTTNTGPQ